MVSIEVGSTGDERLGMFAVEDNEELDVDSCMDDWKGELVKRFDDIPIEEAGEEDSKAETGLPNGVDGVGEGETKLELA